MIALVTNNQFNAYCIDCYQRQSTHANISYGTFICEVCAQIHLTMFGMQKHYIKEIFYEFWDPHQLNVATRGGNKYFFEHCKRIGMEGQGIEIGHKYGHPGVKKHKKNLIANVMGKAVKITAKKPVPTSSNQTAAPKPA